MVVIWQSNSDEFMAVILLWYVGQIKVVYVAWQFMSWRSSWPTQSLLQPKLFWKRLNYVTSIFGNKCWLAEKLVKIASANNDISIAALELQVLQFNRELGLQSVCSFACSSRFPQGPPVSSHFNYFWRDLCMCPRLLHRQCTLRFAGHWCRIFKYNALKVRCIVNVQ